MCDQCHYPAENASFVHVYLLQTEKHLPEFSAVASRVQSPFDGSQIRCTSCRKTSPDHYYSSTVLASSEVPGIETFVIPVVRSAIRTV